MVKVHRRWCWKLVMIFEIRNEVGDIMVGPLCKVNVVKELISPTPDSGKTQSTCLGLEIVSTIVEKEKKTSPLVLTLYLR